MTEPPNVPVLFCKECGSTQIEPLQQPRRPRPLLGALLAYAITLSLMLLTFTGILWLLVKLSTSIWRML